MFTGIVEEIGIVKDKDTTSLNIMAKEVIVDLRCGDSIAVNGTCLTVTHIDDCLFSTDVSPETMRITNLKNLTLGDKVNLERALKFDSRLGGHIVTGHIDTTIELIERRNIDRNVTTFRFLVPDNFIRYIIKKGSVCIDGVSLTVVDVIQNTFSVCIIPHTANQTILGDKDVGYIANLEVDIIGKYVERFVMQDSSPTTGITAELLEKYGFM
jgi:riboflavin synthase